MVLVHQINGNKWGHWFGDQQGSAGSCSGDGVERKGLHIESKV